MDPTTEVTLVLTHGRDQPFQIPSTEARVWEDAVRWGLRRLDPPVTRPLRVDFAFYGDLWRPDIADIALQGTLGDDVEALQADLAADMLAALGEDTTQLQGTMPWDALAGFLQKLDSRFHVGEPVLRLFLQDLSQFFSDAELREKTTGRVAQVIAQAPGPVVLLGHSMGTVVGYDLLARHPQPKVHAFISFGSVLGWDTVQRKVSPTGDLKPPYPTGLPHWFNIYNDKDFATVVRELAPIYLDNGQPKVVDREALGLTPHALNPMAGHDPSVYLSSVGLARALREALVDI